MEADDRLREGVIEAVVATAHGGFQARVGELLS